MFSKTKLTHCLLAKALAISFLLTNCKNKKAGDLEAPLSSKESTSELFTKVSVGNTFDTPPQIANLAANDIDNDGLFDIVICDIKNNTVSLIRQTSNNIFEETILLNEANIPAHIQVSDFDLDGDKDLIVAGLGMLFPNNDKIGSVMVLENDGNLKFTKHLIAEKLWRVADVRVGDIDADGDLDLVTAQFGYDDGETSWIENLGNWNFKHHSLQNISGPINVELIDIDQDTDLDIVSLVSQEWEEIYCFTNDGKGNFTPKLLWGSSNEDFGSSGISISDINKDGKPDILYTNGDAFDYIPPLPRPWHGIQWLENMGNLKFNYHRISNFPGAFSARTFDFDKDNDEDIFVVSGFNHWEKQEAESLIWLENIDDNSFKKHTLAKSPTHLITMELGDFNNDGLTDLVTAGVYVYPPFNNMDRVTIWLNKGIKK